MLGSLACGRFLDRNFRRVAAKNGITVDRKRASSMRNFPIERARLEIIWVPLIIGSSSTLVWGWVRLPMSFSSSHPFHPSFHQAPTTTTTSLPLHDPGPSNPPPSYLPTHPPTLPH